MYGLKNYLLLLSLFFVSLLGLSQDIEVLYAPTWTFPLSGCEVGGPTDQVKVMIRNNGPGATLGNDIYINYYVIDGAGVQSPTITETLPNLGAGLTWQYTFTSATYDFTACDDTLQVVTWVEFIFDNNQVNDTFAYEFINSCTIAPGDISGGTTVCQSGNSGTLYHNNYVNGWVQDWEYNDATTSGWASAANPFLDSLNYTNLQYETYYRVIRASAYCPNDTSLMDTVLLDSVSIAGLTSGSTTVCSGSNSGAIYADPNYFGVFNGWQVWDGSNWISGGVLDSTNYLNITDQHLFYYSVTNGVCPPDTSDTAVVVVDAVSDAGLLLEDDTLCSGPNSDTLYLVGHNGVILDWEIDSLGGVWQSIGITDTFLIVTGMTTTSNFQVIVQNGVCPSDTSNLVTMTIQNAPIISLCPDTTIFEGDSAQLCATGGAAWMWTPDSTLNDGNLQNPMAGPMVTTDYVYHAMSTNGCMNWDTMTVFVEPPVPPADSIVISNLITANGDGINDTWMITDIHLLIGTQVKIWNVYGQEVYASDNYSNDWAGTYNGQKLPNGTYYYWVKIGVYNTEKKGTITILGNE